MTAEEGQPLGEELEVSETEATADSEEPEPTQAPATLSPRLVLDNPTVPAMTSPGQNVEARLDATLFVQGPPGTTVTMVVPVASELEWTITGRDGTRWQPVFLPPPMPRPGGPPTTTVTIPDSGEVEVGTVHGISGFRRPGAAEWQGGLPVGSYEVAVRGFDLGQGASPAAPPVTLTARP